MIDENELLTEWCCRYGVEPDEVGFGGYFKMPGDYMGRCFLRHPCRVEISKVFKDWPFWAKVVLWHEYIHAEAYIKDEYTGGHFGWPFFGRIIRKPFLFIMQVPCAFAHVILELIQQ